MDTKAILQQLDANLLAQDFAGWDPFDGLNSRLFRVLQLHRSSFLRLCWIQAFKRLPVNLRRIAFVPKVSNAKATSLLLRSALLSGDQVRARQLYERLMNARTDAQRWGGGAWGYPFDWQAKAFFVSKETPNVICTAYALLALRAYQAHSTEQGDGSVFTQAAQFVCEHLRQEEGYIGYVPGSRTLVYNASLWGAYVCLEGWRESGDAAFKAVAEEAISHALAAQKPDGSWVYGTAAHHGFIDGFHTGYNLEALYRANLLLQREDIRKAITRGLDFYLQHCFEPDGLAKYYAHNRYPIDPHSAAQGIVTLLTLDRKTYHARAEQIAGAMVVHMWDGARGHFYYQKHARYTNKNAYLRWTQAWMHLALQALLQAENA